MRTVSNCCSDRLRFDLLSEVSCHVFTDHRVGL